MSLTSNISAKTLSNFTCRGSFEIVRTSRFRNWPWFRKLSKICRSNRAKQKYNELISTTVLKSKNVALEHLCLCSSTFHILFHKNNAALSVYSSVLENITQFNYFFSKNDFTLIIELITEKTGVVTGATVAWLKSPALLGGYYLAIIVNKSKEVIRPSICNSPPLLTRS